MSGKEWWAWFCCCHMCGCRICIFRVFLKDIRARGWKGPYAISSGDEGMLNLTEHAGNFSTCWKFISEKGLHAVLELFLACSFPACYLHLRVHLRSTCGLRDVLHFRKHLHLASLQGSVILGLNLSSQRYFAGGLGDRDLQITVRACKNASYWVNAGVITLTLQGLDLDQSQGSSRSKVV